MIDEWIWGDVSRISPEAPVPVVAVREHTFTLGGAGNVANNLRALGAQVAFVGGVGDDAEGARLRAMFDDLGVDAHGLVTLADRPTTRKTRVVAHNQQVVRADWESTAPLRDDDRARVVERGAKWRCATRTPSCSATTRRVFCTARSCEAALAAPVVVADPKPQNVGDVRRRDVHRAQRRRSIARERHRDRRRRVARPRRPRAAAAADCRWVLITRGEHGMSLFGANGERFDVPAVARTVFDVSGAGDTVVAVLTLALAAQIPAETATQLANFAAAAVVEKLGTATATADEIVALMEHAHPG